VAYQGTEALIQVRDDGAGLALDRLRERAVDLDLLAAQAGRLRPLPSHHGPGGRSQDRALGRATRAGEKHRRKALELGASDYLVKPFQESTLLETIQRVAPSLAEKPYIEAPYIEA